MLHKVLKHQLKKAFTMLELIFVIVVVGILAAIIFSQTRTDPIYEAANQVLSHIRYTQHLAMVDDKYVSGQNWWRARWQIYFKHDNDGSQDVVYMIYSDLNLDGVGVSANPDAGEIAEDPMSGRDLTGDSLYATTSIGSMNLSNRYGVVQANMNNLMAGGCANGRRIFFDHLGRPLLESDTNSSEQILVTNCDITLTNGNENLVIRIAPETGYACILDDNNNCI